ncbi:MAG: Fic family protein [Chloroflexota bacterium]
MNPTDFSPNTPGNLIRTRSGYWAFVPNPLPPKIDWSADLISLLSEADRALTQLGEVGQAFQASHIMVKPFVRQEAVLSSRIEGTRTSLEELYTYEAAHLSFLESRADAHKVHNYVSALEYGLGRLTTLPVSLRLIRELHQRLMQGVRGEHWTPGEFRRSQNWIGPPGATIETATYVPPPVDEMHTALDQFEKYIHEPPKLPPLVRLGLIHYQFESIHPFLDGNGRVGRLLTTLLLCEWDLLLQPFLYLSAYFEAQRSQYYRHLMAVSQHGDWDGWLRFFLMGVRDQSRESRERVMALNALRVSYQRQLQDERAVEQLMRVIDFLFGQPIATIRQIETGIKASDYKVAQRYVEKLEQHGILREITGKARNRVYRADKILNTIKV